MRYAVPSSALKGPLSKVPAPFLPESLSFLLLCLLPQASDTCKFDNLGNKDTVNASVRITEVEERVEREAKEQVENAAREKMDKPSRRRVWLKSLSDF